MRIARFSLGDQVGFGAVEGLSPDLRPTPETVLRVLEGHPFADIALRDVTVPFSEVKLLAPVLPSKIAAVARNYAAHAREMGGEAPEEPIIFLKPSTSVIGPDDPIRLPSISAQVEHEGELAVVIGRLCRRVPRERAHEVVLGYTCSNDVTARDLQRREAQWGRAKGFDTFCPLGPWIETDLDPTDLGVRVLVDDQVRQDGRTSEMVHTVADLVAWVSAAMTLLPGDVLLTGTPAGVGPLKAGEVVSVAIDGIGELSNEVVDDV